MALGESRLDSKNWTSATCLLATAYDSTGELNYRALEMMLNVSAKCECLTQLPIVTFEKTSIEFEWKDASRSLALTEVNGYFHWVNKVNDQIICEATERNLSNEFFSMLGYFSFEAFNNANVFH